MSVVTAPSVIITAFVTSLVTVMGVPPRSCGWATECWLFRLTKVESEVLKSKAAISSTPASHFLPEGYSFFAGVQMLASDSFASWLLIASSLTLCFYSLK